MECGYFICINLWWWGISFNDG